MSLKSMNVAVLAASACAAVSLSFLPEGGLFLPGAAGNDTALPDSHVLDNALEALQVMQGSYFQPWLGTWPTSIDWTAAVMGSHISGALQSLSQILACLRSSEPRDHQVKENLVATYFTQLVGYYFGQDAFAIRNEAFDDILWVVLGWLDTIQFIDLHTALHYQTGPSAADIALHQQQVPRLLVNQSWHGNLWTSAFAHRARIFWELANKGWDEKLCGGGMTWNPRLEPYKNAITNELFISASMAMYLYFPGDDNASPFGSGDTANGGMEDDESTTTGWQPHDTRYLHAAIRTYSWLKRSGMLNSRGLYIDGFHISGYNNPYVNNTRCDVPNGMLYTYNQGVILSGQLGLFQVTGNTSYLTDGHQLIQDVIAATGYDVKTNKPLDDISSLPPGRLPYWHGLGRAGILEEVCDVRGDCSQDAHTFKGIYFHHLTTFCAPLQFVSDLAPAMDRHALRQVKEAHAHACMAYVGWIRHNAMAALLTRDAEGKFGMWWTAGLLNLTMDTLDIQEGDLGPEDPTAVDYRNGGGADDPRWMTPGSRKRPPSADSRQERGQKPLGKRSVVDGDPNNRGRGRTVETQGGGLAVLRALWEISRHGRS